MRIAVSEVNKVCRLEVNPQAPVFDVSKVKESSFYKSDLTDPPPQIFDAHLLEKNRFKPFQISFFSGFYIKIMF